MIHFTIYAFLLWDLSSSKHALNGEQKILDTCHAPVVVLLLNGTGFFKSLIQEFAVDNVPVSISIMPLPYVLTETVSNVVTTYYTVLNYINYDCLLFV